MNVHKPSADCEKCVAGVLSGIYMVWVDRKSSVEVLKSSFKTFTIRVSGNKVIEIKVH